MEWDDAWFYFFLTLMGLALLLGVFVMGCCAGHNHQPGLYELHLKYHETHGFGNYCSECSNEKERASDERKRPVTHVTALPVVVNR